jgi:rifampicin phosphotransferase
MAELCSLDDVAADGMALVGGKALNLAKMRKAGLPVPAGFCVTTEAQRVNRGARLSNGLESKIRDFYQRLGAGQVAVRSSATLEDGSANSFAGQHETTLALQGEEAVCNAVLRCWASGSSARVRAYRAQRRLIEVDQGMAVLVQSLVPAEVAGVIFTRNPLDVAANEMLVEASWGIGEPLVSGRVTPDRWYLDRDKGTVRRQHISVKTVEMTSNGTYPVSVERQKKACLDEGKLQEIACLARRAESLFTGPLDIEWALAKGQFWLVQARPITVVSSVDECEAVRRSEIAAVVAMAQPTGTVWSRFSLSEVLPTATPMTWSIVRRLLSGQGGLGLMYRDLGFDPDPALDAECIFDLICGRPYCNLDREPRMYYHELPLEYSFAKLKADPKKAMFPQPSLSPARLSWRFWAALPIRLPRLVTRMIRAQRTRRELGETFEDRFLTIVVPAFVKEAESALADNLVGVSPAGLLQRLEFWLQRVLVDFARESLKPTALALLALDRVAKQLARFLKPERAGQAARELMVGVRLHPEADLVAAMRKVMAGRFDWDRFIERFGHRGCNEMELAEPRFAEEAGLRLGDGPRHHSAGGDILRSGAIDSPDVIWRRIAAEANLRGSIAESIRQDVAALRSWVTLRETAKHYFMLGYAVIRRLLCQLDHCCDLDGGIFYLTIDEIQSMPQKELLDQLIPARRRYHRLATKLEVPSVLFSDDLDSIGRPSFLSKTSSLQGTALSFGLAEGPAIVLNEPIDGRITGPYVLVCPSMDPAWVPLFVEASALVMEIGGVLSHGAIVAREFGIPAVAGLPGVQRLIRTGQPVRVDGTSGVVTLLDWHP